MSSKPSVKRTSTERQVLLCLFCTGTMKGALQGNQVFMYKQDSTNICREFPSKFARIHGYLLPEGSIKQPELLKITCTKHEPSLCCHWL